MSTLAPGLLAVLLALPIPRNSPEAPEERAQRLALVAGELGAAIDGAVMTGRLPGAERSLWAAAAAATLVRESGNVSRAVHSGERLGDGGRSICLMQVNLGNPAGYLPPASPRPVSQDAVAPSRSQSFFWKRLAGLDREATTRCVRGGIRSLARMRRYCARRVPPDELLVATLSAYMHGSSCEPSDEGRRRAVLAGKLLPFTSDRRPPPPP